MGKVYLVGAGPGDVGLITVKGLEKISKCDAVVYDRLANEELLDFLKPGCEKIYVGKAAGKHYKKQDKINKILLECARKHNIVVRLKGGDPFVFGRGGEEIEALTGENIPYEVIPGVTSAVAVPECAGIPVTHRGVSRSFHVITGHTMSEGVAETDRRELKPPGFSADDFDDLPAGKLVDDSEKNASELNYDFETMAKMEGTIVFLMGLKNLAYISASLIKAGKPGATPVAVISDGTTVYQRTVYGNLENIAYEVEKAKLPSPAVIVMGDTAAYRYTYRSESCKKVGITATDMLWDKLETGIEGLGMQPVPVCRMQLCETEGMAVLEKIIKSHHNSPAFDDFKCAEDRYELKYENAKADKLFGLIDYNWLVFTSQNAIKLFFDRVHKLRLDMRSLAHMKFAVLGSGTAAKLLEYGFHADFIPVRYNVADFAEEFSRFIREETPADEDLRHRSLYPRILIPRAIQGSTELTRIFDKNGLTYTDLPIYDVRGAATKQMDNLDELDCLVFVSASGVTAFFDELDSKKRVPPKNIRYACIGTVTANRLREEYEKHNPGVKPPTIISSVNDVDGLLNVMKNQFESGSGDFQPDFRSEDTDMLQIKQERQLNIKEEGERR